MADERLFELRRRTFNTPHFRGIEFIEVEAKSILNHVPGTYLPFNWTINPYRGCSHACTYCMGGDTPVLMADGRAKPLADVRIGDAVYGTEQRGAARRYVTTTVLNHWSTVKPAHRITLEDGTELVASGDHRFLSDRGWKYVSGAGHGGFRGNHLTLNDELMGTGKFDSGPRQAISRRRAIEGQAIKSTAKLRVVSVEPLGVDLPMFDITTGTGDFIANGVVSHNCFARVTHSYLDMNAGRDFESKIVVKVNAAKLLRKELRARRWKGEPVAMGTNTDPYQRAEGKYGLMPGIIEALAEVRNPFSILTKGTLILRDIELLAGAASVTDVSTALSVGTLDEQAWRKSEPGTLHPRKRLEAVARLNDAGVPCGVMVAPVLPGISDRDDQLEAVVEAALDAGATHVSPILLHLRPGVKEEYMRWLEVAYPHLVARYQSMYKRSAYASTKDRDKLSERIGDMVGSRGGTRSPRPSERRFRSRGAPDKTGEPRPQQMSLL